MRYFDEVMIELFEEQIDTKKGKLVIKTIIKPEAIYPDGINKLDFEESDYEEVGIYIPYPNPNQHEINMLKQRLTNTDYVTAKIIEGAATISDYAEIIEKRNQWRKRINELENAIVTTEE